MSSPGQRPITWDDKLTIETPEQTSLEFPLAGVGSRALALLLDTLIQAVAAIAIIILLVIFSRGVAAVTVRVQAAVGLWFEAIMVLIWFVIYYGYFAIFESVWNGQTPGKRIAHLRVIQESGRPVQVWQSVARNVMRFIDQLPSFYAVGLVSALISKQNRRLGDFVAGTVVVHERPLTKIAVGWTSTPLEGAPAMRLGAARLGPEETRLIEAFLQRRDSLDIEVRSRMAHQIAERTAAKLGTTLEDARTAGFATDEKFIEAVARERFGAAQDNYSANK
jgi:uncharacterized RDD family membrane protein YckC